MSIGIYKQYIISININPERWVFSPFHSSVNGFREMKWLTQSYCLLIAKSWFEFRAATLPLGVSSIILSGTHLVTHLSVHLFIQLEFFLHCPWVWHYVRPRGSVISHTDMPWGTAIKNMRGGSCPSGFTGDMRHMDTTSSGIVAWNDSWSEPRW